MADRNTKAKAHIQWASDNGAVLSKLVQFEQVEQYGMSLIATEDLPKHYKVLSLPHHLSLAISTCSNELLVKKLQKIEEEEEEEDKIAISSLVLTIVFIYEFVQADTRWRCYFDSLPSVEEMPIAVFWSKEEMDWLHGCVLSYTQKDELAKFHKDFEQIVYPILQNKKIFKEERTESEWKDLYKWAHCCIMSRSFGPQGDDDEDSSQEEEEEEEEGDDDEESEQTEKKKEKSDDDESMCYPVIDLINGKPKTYENVQLVVDDGIVSIMTVADVKKGEQLFLNYGEKTNGDLLQLYGFATPVNRYYECALDITALFATFVKENGESAPAKIDFLVENQFLDDVDRYFVVSGLLTEVSGVTSIDMESFDDDSLLLVLKIFAFDDTELEQLLAGNVSFNALSLSCRNITSVNAMYQQLITESMHRVHQPTAVIPSLPSQHAKKAAADLIRQSEERFLHLLKELVDCVLAPIATAATESSCASSGHKH